jgi:hypothetical protein
VCLQGFARPFFPRVFLPETPLEISIFVHPFRGVIEAGKAAFLRSFPELKIEKRRKIEIF